jgi:AcrR family transcriptional regulator
MICAVGHEEPAETAPDSHSPRVERRRRAVRAKILSAAEGLLRAGAVEDVTIAHITEEADVGYGTFYLHFDTKLDVMAAIAREHSARLTARLDALADNIADPAEVVAVALRYMLRAIKDDPLWSWFILRSGLPMERLRECVGISATRDFARGREAGRFHWNDEGVLAPFIAGAIIGVLSECASARLPDDTPEQAAEFMLATLGVPREEAAAIARKKLPPLPPE